MKIFTLIIVLLSVSLGYSQSIYKSSYSSIGNTISDGRSLVQSVGQIQPIGVVKDEYSVKQGFLENGNMGVASIEEFELGRVYPNPVGDMLITGSYKKLTLRAITGAVIYHSSYGVNLSTLNLTEGFYVVEIEREDGRLENHKIIKN